MSHYNPYSALKSRFKEFVAEIDALPATVRRAFSWSKEQLNTPSCVNLRDIREQANAGSRLGFEMIVEDLDGTLQFYFRKKIPSTPYVY